MGNRSRAASSSSNLTPEVPMLGEHPLPLNDAPGPLNDAPGEALQLTRLRVGELMTRNVVCVRPDLSLDAVSHLFLERGLRAAPVVDGEDCLLGTVSELDVRLETAARGTEGERVVMDAMVPVALTIAENASITLAAAVMAYEAAQYVVVLSAQGEVVGLVSATDVLHWIARADGYRLPPK